MTTALAIADELNYAGTRSLSHDTQQFLTFTLGEEEYGVDIMMVREVKGWTDTTRLPNTPLYMRGVLNLRGNVIPIFDLRARFTGQLTEANSKHVIIVLAVGDRIIGILADTVSDILTVEQDEIKPAPDTSSDNEARYVAGLIALENRMVVILEMSGVLKSDDKLIGSMISQTTSQLTQ
jgi:purine-binding chemotaxis protein CheW